jgi:hypothetical protein
MLAMLAALAALLACVEPVNNGGDFLEYTVQTVAVASHGTPDVRLSDLATVKRLLPQQAWAYALLEDDMVAGKHEVYAAFVRGRDERVYAVHFFAFPLLAAVPFKLLEWGGLAPFRCYQLLNLSLVFVLGLALYRLYGQGWKAGLGLLLFMGCGGVLYWPWSSPECLSAAALLAGLLFYVSGAPLRGSLLGGLAALQNPTIIFFFGFAPLLRLVADWQPALGLAGNLRRQLPRRTLAALAAGVALAALAPLFNLYQYGVPNIIVKKFSDPGLISLTRLASFFFDLNQGMLIAVPGVALALLALRTPQARRGALLLAVALLFVLAVTVPALAVLNWNSGAVGIMRYVAWAAMPLLLVLYWRLHLLQRWPAVLLTAAGALQALCMAHALRYDYIHFSPLAELALRVAPAYYHPEPEIFAERSTGTDNYLHAAQLYVYPQHGQPVKWLYHAGEPGIEARLCGAGMRLGPHNRLTDSTRGWRYLDGQPQCEVDRTQPIRLQLADMQQARALQLQAGWSEPGAGGGIWDGAWSIDERSQLEIALPPQWPLHWLQFHGHYADGNRRTRVLVNGTDLGWVALDQPAALAVTAPADGRLHIELRHEAPQLAGNGDPRRFAYFLQGVTLR